MDFSWRFVMFAPPANSTICGNRIVVFRIACLSCGKSSLTGWHSLKIGINRLSVQSFTMSSVCPTNNVGPDFCATIKHAIVSIIVVLPPPVGARRKICVVSSSLAANSGSFSHGATLGSKREARSELGKLTFSLAQSRIVPGYASLMPAAMPSSNGFIIP